ncbi:hypothetical protein KQX54_000894 [Cotesia glomerata]|uniref:CCHC-type domain-containing protein n=1 Tax=Cotesia glomerata TaxID=32391 RepID=A0AAV7IZ91_COTGL|nr:hypothetical protein KQX54_000894 [Cotesia glomerata]
MRVRNSDFLAMVKNQKRERGQTSVSRKERNKGIEGATTKERNTSHAEDKLTASGKRKRYRKGSKEKGRSINHSERAPKSSKLASRSSGVAVGSMRTVMKTARTIKGVIEKLRQNSGHTEDFFAILNRLTKLLQEENESTAKFGARLESMRSQAANKIDRCRSIEDIVHRREREHARIRLATYGEELQVEESIKKPNKETIGEEPLVFTVTNDAANIDQGGPKCYRCGEVGHFIRNCSVQNERRQQVRRGSYNPRGTGQLYKNNSRNNASNCDNRRSYGNNYYVNNDQASRGYQGNYRGQERGKNYQNRRSQGQQQPADSRRDGSMGPLYQQQPWQQDQRSPQNQQQQHRQPISNSNKNSDYLRNSGSNNRNRDSISGTINRLGQKGHFFCMEKSSEKFIQNIEGRIIRRIYVTISRFQKTVHRHDRCVRICSGGNIKSREELREKVKRALRRKKMIDTAREELEEVKFLRHLQRHELDRVMSYLEIEDLVKIVNPKNISTTEEE